MEFRTRICHLRASLVCSKSELGGIADKSVAASRAFMVYNSFKPQGCISHLPAYFDGPFRDHVTHDTCI
jgi:hypothetical protein